MQGSGFHSSVLPTNEGNWSEGNGRGGTTEKTVVGKGEILPFSRPLELQVAPDSDISGKGAGWWIHRSGFCVDLR